jgi:hypothetical protein
MQEITDWFIPRLTDVFGDGATVTVDKEEITVLGPIPARPDEAGAESVADYRERTRAARIDIARQAEELFRRKVSWGVRDGDDVVLFTHLAVPVMTRLRQNERRVLDTLVAGGVARSRSDALAWCVRLVGRHEGDWIARLQDALRSVDEARATGPDAG